MTFRTRIIFLFVVSACIDVHFLYSIKHFSERRCTSTSRVLCRLHASQGGTQHYNASGLSPLHVHILLEMSNLPDTVSLYNTAVQSWSRLLPEGLLLSLSTPLLRLPASSSGCHIDIHYKISSVSQPRPHFTYSLQIGRVEAKVSRSLCTSPLSHSFLDCLLHH